MTDKSFIKEGTIRSFGRIANRMSKQEQADLDTLLDKYSLTESDIKVLDKTYEGKNILLEIGCGKGEQIIERAKKNPDQIFIACEVFKNSLAKIARAIEEFDLKNLKVFYHDARLLLDALPENSVDTIMVLYPDPWPKNKQKKRRIVNEYLVNGAYNAIKEDGKFILATDITDYALWMLKHILNYDKFNCIAAYPEEWMVEPDGWVSTSYEKKARNLGRKSWYLQFLKGDIEKQYTKAK